METGGLQEVVTVGCVQRDGLCQGPEARAGFTQPQGCCYRVLSRGGVSRLSLREAYEAAVWAAVMRARIEAENLPSGLFVKPQGAAGPSGWWDG